MPPATPVALHACHVLVLGAGLAGMRAAWAAKEADPRLDVLLVSPRERPCGSSFANRNNALGVQAPLPHEAEAFVAEVLRLAPPGTVLPELVRALAQDAPQRLNDLLNLNLSFRRGPDGALSRFPGCFSAIPRAVVFDGLAAAHAKFLARVRGLGVRVLHGYEAVEILRHGDRACGARLDAMRGDGSLDVAAGAVIAALGGPAPLFARRLCGPGGSGLSYGLLHQAGARLVNVRHLQFFWSRARDRAFVNPGDLPWARMAPRLAHLATARRSHCPLAFSLPDAALDLELLARRDNRGLVRLPEQEPIALYAHAGNGGALINEQGRTTAPGLLACGECAGGMHGAQRLGGGMVLSALVFGARAGIAAAREAGFQEPTLRGQALSGARARGTDAPGAAATQARGRADGPPAPDDAPTHAVFLRRLRRGMERHGLPGAERGTARAAFAAWLRDVSKRAGPQRRRLLALSALLVLGEMD